MVMRMHNKMMQWNIEKCSLAKVGSSRIPVQAWSKFDYISEGPFKYYVINEVGRWGQKMAIFDDL